MMHIISVVVSPRSGLFRTLKLRLHVTDKLSFYKIGFSRECTRYGLFAVVRLDTDTTYYLEKAQRIFLQSLYTGMTIKESSEKARISVASGFVLVEKFVGLGLIRNIGEVRLFDFFENQKFRSLNLWSDRIIDKRLKWFVGWLMCSLALIGICGLIFVSDFRPEVEMFFWHPSPVIVVVSLTIVGYVLTILHELAHYSVSRSLGLPAKISLIESRMLNFVMQTTTYHLALRPKMERIAVYVAGMVFDLASCGLILLMIMHWSILPGTLVYQFLMMIVLLQVLGVLWQFNLYLRTDVYNVIVDIFDVPLLYENSLKYWRSKFARKSLMNKINKVLFGQIENDSDDFRLLNRKERAFLRIYVWCIVSGVFYTVILFGWVTIPRDLRLLVELGTVLSGVRLWTWDWWVVVLALILHVHVYGMLFWSIRSKLIAKKYIL